MSTRGKWADIFWFSLFHEIGHILLHQKKTYIDDGNVLPGLARQEKEADKFAVNSLIGKERFGPFIRKGDFGEAAVKSLPIFASSGKLPVLKPSKSARR
jgi:HTH-type transcriptional regulator/antitoxin HigA